MGRPKPVIRKRDGYWLCLHPATGFTSTGVRVTVHRSWRAALASLADTPGGGGGGTQERAEHWVTGSGAQPAWSPLGYPEEWRDSARAGLAG